MRGEAKLRIFWLPKAVGTVSSADTRLNAQGPRVAGVGSEARQHSFTSVRGLASLFVF